MFFFFFFQAEDGIRDLYVTGVQTCALPISLPPSCAGVTTARDDKASIRELRKRVEAENEVDPTAAFGILCSTIPRVARRYGETLGDIHVAYAWTYVRQGRHTEAGTAWNEALKVRERYPGKKKIELQQVLVGLAQVQLAQRQFALAEHNIEPAHAIVEENHDAVSEAGAAIESARTAVAFRQERYEDARRHAEETL